MMRPVDATLLSAQRDHWATTLAVNSDMYGNEPSESAVAAADVFADNGIADVVELGAGQGRDTLHFARRGFHVHALDYASEAVEAIRAKSEAAGVTERVTVEQHDVREPMPFADGKVDACYSHMLFCMALTTPELEHLSADLRRAVRPGGLVVYTARTTGDAHYGTGIPRGDDMYEHGGFIVHFFDRALIDKLASAFELVDVAEFIEGDLPRRLIRVTMRVPQR
jgi:SAM-dependent methyltransferase